MNKEKWGLIAGLVLFALIGFILPIDAPFKARFALATTCLMATWWIFEALPLAVTALLPLILFPVSGIMSLEETGSGYSEPIIYLFLGGFIIALSVERWNLHKRIALFIISQFKSSLSTLVAGFIFATGILSMWISNTATALMMLPIGLAVVQQLEQVGNEAFQNEKVFFGKALLLGIAYASSIGGIGTLIGTPTNMVFTGFVDKQYPNAPVSFIEWLIFAMPATIIMLIMCWYYLVKFGFPLKSRLTPEMIAILKEERHKLGVWSWEEKAVALVFGTVASCWILRDFILQLLKTNGLEIKGISDTTIALVGAMILFLIPSQQKRGESLMTWQEAGKLPWDIILLFGGGLSLAKGFDKSGLANWIAGKLTVLSDIPFLALLFALSILVLMLTEFASNVATVSMMLPVLASLATSLNVHPYILMVSATCVASAGFMMPMGTAANALVFATGKLKMIDMIRAGFWLDLVSIILFTLWAYYLVPILFTM
jgi:solute carrier family 13 (sodium-dependent dicarboxylate transporter), member 2/3/5